MINMNNNNNIYKIKGLLPCSQLNPISIGINILSIFKVIFFPALLLTILYSYFNIYLVKKRNNIQRDLMTNFYRRDYYEKKMVKTEGF